MSNRNAAFGFSSFLTDLDREHGVGIVITNGNLYRNVTEPVNTALALTAAEAAHRHSLTYGIIFGMRYCRDPHGIQQADNLLWFIGQVNHGGPWDIKRPNSWNDTIGSTFPGSFDTPIYFRGYRKTPESLGNWTYGYIGAAMGFTLLELIGGSWFADGFSLPFGLRGDWENERGDWSYIQRGFNARRGR